MSNNIVIRLSALPKLLSNDLQTYLESLDFRLYVNNVTPNDALGNSQFSECVDSGYSPQTSPFTSPTLNGSNQGETDSGILTNVMGHTVPTYTIYGIYVTDPGDSDEWVFAGLAGPLTITAAGQIAQIACRFLADQLP